MAASGAPATLEDVTSLHEQGIRAIVTLTEHPLTVRKQLTPQVLAELDITTCHASIIDQHPPKKATVEQVVVFINQMKAAQKPVLVHCAAGVGRTGTMLHAYYLSQGMNFEEVKALIKKKRPISQFIMLTDSQQAFIEQYATQLNS